jgi:hypothetical protein
LRLWSGVFRRPQIAANASGRQEHEVIGNHRALRQHSQLPLIVIGDQFFWQGKLLRQVLDCIAMCRKLFCG